MLQAFAAAARRRRREADVWGHGWPPVALTLADTQAVFVNRHLFTKTECATFGDFLRFYITHRLPSEWCEAYGRDASEHVLLRLAHDLYELEHAGVLPRKALKLLTLARRSAQARMELGLAARLVRAGFTPSDDLRSAGFEPSGETFKLAALAPDPPNLAAATSLFRDAADRVLVFARAAEGAEPFAHSSALACSLKTALHDRTWSVALLVVVAQGGWSEAHLLLPRVAGLANDAVRSRVVSPTAELRRRRPALHALLDGLRRRPAPFELPLATEPA